MIYHTLKYYLTPLLIPVAVTGLFLGGVWMWLGVFQLIIIMTLGDEFTTEDTAIPDYKYPLLIEIPLHLALPIITAMLVAFAWTSGRGDSDFLGISSFLSRFTYYDFIAARNSNDWYHYLGAIIGMGFLVAGYGTNVAHELTHRVKNKIAMLEGRWLLSASWNPDFAIEHVYGHHTYVGTDKDPATARVGENVYTFAIRSTIMGHLSAWKIEIGLLKKKGRSIFSVYNRLLTGYLMCLCWAVLFYIAGGSFGLFLFLAQAGIAKFILEIVNYMEHYGLRRNPDEPVRPEHSWNTNKRMSGLVLFSLTRHSAHHEKPTIKFWKLDPYKDAPQMPYGYLTTLLLCLIPPLWYRVINPRLAALKLSHAG